MFDESIMLVDPPSSFIYFIMLLYNILFYYSLDFGLQI